MTERDHRELRARPGAEILRRNLVAGDVAQIGIHILGSDVARHIVLAEIAEELLPRQVLTFLDDAGEAQVFEIDVALDAVLGAKIEDDLPAFHTHMAIAQRRQAEAFIGLCIFLVADPRQRALEQPHDRRQYLLLGQARQGEIMRHPRANLRQHLREEQQLAVLLRIANGVPLRMIAILFAAARVAPTACMCPFVPLLIQTSR